MPWKPDAPCRVPGCPGLGSGGYCARHKTERAERRAATAAAHDAKRGSAHARGYDKRWQRLRLMVLREEVVCRVCGMLATDVDHIVPKSQGGTDARENLQALCHADHSRKTNRDKRDGEGSVHL